MAAVTSLGIHQPIGLPYLIAEGILPKDPTRDLYRWETYIVGDHEDAIEEEVLVAKHCVVWSQASVVRAVYRFDLEGEDIVQAVLTSFPKLKSSPKHQLKPTPASFNNISNGPHRVPQDDPRRPSKETRPVATPSEGEARALAVFLKSKAHIYFLHDSHCLVDLPFEVERVFPAPCGLVLQRKLSPLPALPPTPKVPPAPHNSFFSSQVTIGSSYLQSPTLQKSLNSSQPAGAKSSNVGDGWFNGLWQNMLDSPGRNDRTEAASLFTLTDPLSELGLLTESLQHQKVRLTGKPQRSLSVEFDALDAAEQIVYVSPKDELPPRLSRKGERHGPLTLIVSANYDLGLVTIWHAWYITEKSLADLMKQRAEHKSAKARRRSSFLSVSMGTGATTPAVRNREGARESFAAAPHATAPPSRKPTRQEEEATMASQLDPDFQVDGIQQPGKKDSRRISSLVARGELATSEARASQSIAGPSFGAAGGRRNPSFGGMSDRKTFGLRKSRGSTPGSTFSKSIGPDDDTMDLDSESASASDETVEDIVRHIRATHEATGTEGIFGTLDEGWKRDVVVRKIHSFGFGPIRSSIGSTVTPCAFKVATLPVPWAASKAVDEKMAVYLHDQAGRQLFCLHLEVKQRPLWQDLPASPYVAVPIIERHGKESVDADILRFASNTTDAVLLSGRGIRLSPEISSLCPLPPPTPYRIYEPSAVIVQMRQADRDIGRNRTLPPPKEPLILSHAGIGGAFDEIDRDGSCHRRQIQLGPKDASIREVLDICELVLPSEAATLVRNLWCTIHAHILNQPKLLDGTACSAEWIAVAATIFACVSGLVDQKARASLHISTVATARETSSPSSAFLLRQRQHEATLLAKSAWTALRESNAASKSDRTSSSGAGKPDRAIPIATSLADELGTIVAVADMDECVNRAVKLILALHILREEHKLNVCLSQTKHRADLAPLIAQLGWWLNLPAWTSQHGCYYAFEGASEGKWQFVKSSSSLRLSLEVMETPIGVFEWLEHSIKHRSTEQYPSLATVTQLGNDVQMPLAVVETAQAYTTRTTMLSGILEDTRGLISEPVAIVETMSRHKMTSEVLESLPEGVAAPFREAIARCEREPPTLWSSDLLRLVGRNDLGRDNLGSRDPPSTSPAGSNAPLHDIQSICHGVEQATHATKTREASRNAVSQLLFSEDRRMVEATSLMHFNSVQTAECAKQPDWTDAFHFEQQRRVMQFVTTRMIALPAGDGMLHYDSQAPLMTEKYHLPGFSSSCIMRPMGHTVTTDRSGLTEEKVNWAYFHAGASAGLRISRKARGIDTSWLVFNKPSELTNRHAGLLLALGLGGHLKQLAKWLSFKYLTPKHTMTSIGLLLGISASYLGSMDGLITRMLSVHISSMLPPGAAELNVSPLTQTAGLMGIGLLYYNTQHRRMSEIMLQEIEILDVEDPDNGPDLLRDESYRLAAGFALGYINLGRGKDLRGLHGMQMPERLLRIAVGPRPVSAAHVFDKATAGAIIATALVYMKTGDAAIARKVDVPDTEAQFDHVRPDMLMLRSMAKHVILWNAIEASSQEFAGEAVATWISRNLPACCKAKWQELGGPLASLKSCHVPFYYIVTGLAWALGLKYAGTGSLSARNEILTVIDLFWKLARRRSDGYYYYDTKLARSCIRRCIEVLSLCAATIMAGTGDLQTFRYLRRLHGRTDAETPYGSHLAAHMAIGVLFLAGGSYTFGTSDLAVASLICSLYPLFPIDVHDNRVHLQAFRHLWVFAVDARCLVVEDIDTRRPIHMPITVRLRSGKILSLRAPCLLPELDAVAAISTDDPSYWKVTLDFAQNPVHLSSFRANQNIFVRRCPASDAHDSIFSATLAALGQLDGRHQANSAIWSWVFSLPALKELDKSDIERILPPDERSSVRTEGRGTSVDDRLVLRGNARSSERDRLWDLRVLFSWAERMTQEDGKMKWIGRDVIEVLKFTIEERKRAFS